jgi:asparagine synthetase B (glutamine-hydrolysing)
MTDKRTIEQREKRDPTRSIARLMRDRPSEFRQTVMEAIQQVLGIGHPTDVALSLSGGIDSTTLLFALLELGYAPHCYTFRLGDSDSPDSAAARSITTTLGVPWTCIDIPRTTAALVTDIRRVMSITGSARKVFVQCPHPYLYVAPAIARDGFTQCLVGTSADNLWGTSKELMMDARVEDATDVRLLREQDATNVVTTSANTALVAQHFGVTLSDPYREHQPWIDLMLDTPWKLLHAPKIKALAIYAFSDYWNRGRWYRKNQLYQVVSGIREWHDTLLADPVLNPTGAKAVVALYNRWLSEMVAAGLAPASPVIVDPNPDPDT